MLFSRLSSNLRLNVAFNYTFLRSFQQQNIIRPIIINRTLFSSNTSRNAAPTAYEADKDFYALKVTIDDIRAKYGLGGGSRIKDANLEQNSDLDLEVDLTLADVKKLTKIQELLENASQDLSRLISSKPGNIEGINDDDIVIKANAKKSVWLAEDDDVSGYAEKAIKAYKENKVVGDVHAYDIDDVKKYTKWIEYEQHIMAYFSTSVYTAGLRRANDENCNLQEKEIRYMVCFNISVTTMICVGQKFVELSRIPKYNLKSQLLKYTLFKRNQFKSMLIHIQTSNWTRNWYKNTNFASHSCRISNIYGQYKRVVVQAVMDYLQNSISSDETLTHIKYLSDTKNKMREVLFIVQTCISVVNRQLLIILHGKDLLPQECNICDNCI
ncbi:hypothetical protein RclHR1_09960001 [Rhizophagus clarus]|uniref:Uncharacterized protein n=1 Tax=Rhizophagus clarus TaxID=94130 RepID=A0A2Z6SIP7_9GLOM|nr:hypothetical protein RclHR1_09960001 [Rhizophagus clarus]